MASMSYEELRELSQGGERVRVLDGMASRFCLSVIMLMFGSSSSSSSSSSISSSSSSSSSSVYTRSP